MPAHRGWHGFGSVALSTVGVVLVLIGDVFLGVWVGHLWQAVAWISFGVGIVAIAVGVFAVRRAHLHLARRSAVIRWTLVVLGTASLVFATWTVARGWQPFDPATLSTNGTCGSALRPRRFSSDFFGDFTGFTRQGAVEDCENVWGTTRGVGVAFGLIGIELAAVGLRRDPDREQRRETRYPLQTVAVMGVLVLVVTGVLATRSSEQIRRADDHDRAALASQGPMFDVLLRATNVGADVADLVPAVKPEFDWPAIVRVCVKVSSDTKKLVEVEGTVRGKVEQPFRARLDRLAQDMGRLGDTCVARGSARDEQAFKASIRPLTKAIPIEVDRLSSLADIR